MKIYWTALNTLIEEKITEHSLQFINYLEPVSTFELLNNLPSDNLEMQHNFKYCPAMKRRVSNSYELLFPFDYRLKFDNSGGGRVVTDIYDQKFFDDIVTIRNNKIKLVSLNLMYIFIPEKSVEIQTTNSYLSDNEFVNRTIAMPGQFNIYDWIRNIEFAFFLKKDFDEVNIKKGDPYLNVKFLTDEKVELCKFYPTDNFSVMLRRNWIARNYKMPSIKPLKYYYDMFNQSKMRKAFMREIQNNLLD